MWRLVAWLTISLAMAAGGGAAATGPGVPLPRVLPDQVLVAQSTHGLRLLDLDGRVHARLGGLRLETPFFDGRLGPIVSRGKRTFQLDLGSRSLRPVGSLGHSLRIRFGDTDVWLERGGKRVASLGRHGAAWLTPDGSLLTIGSYDPGGWRRLIDLDSGETHRLPQGCVVYSRRGSVLRAFCSSAENGRGRHVLRLLRSSGTGWTGEGLWRNAEASWRSALLSPDGRSVLVQALMPCEEGAVELVTAGHRHVLTSNGYALGWTRAGKALVYVHQGGCDVRVSARAGVYSIGPASGSRHRILRARAALWPPAPTEPPPAEKSRVGSTAVTESTQLLVKPIQQALLSCSDPVGGWGEAGGQAPAGCVSTSSAA